MTKKEAINMVQGARQYLTAGNPMWNAKKIDEAMSTAIEALERYDSEGCWENREHVQVDENGYDVATCSICGIEITLEYPYDNYCPNCGTWMKPE